MLNLLRLSNVHRQEDHDIATKRHGAFICDAGRISKEMLDLLPSWPTVLCRVG